MRMSEILKTLESIQHEMRDRNELLTEQGFDDNDEARAKLYVIADVQLEQVKQLLRVTVTL